MCKIDRETGGGQANHPVGHVGAADKKKKKVKVNNGIQ
jgi:hypothetical protein